VKRRNARNPARWLRPALQAAFLTVTAYAIVRHRAGEAAGLEGARNPAPGVDSLSPFGGLETLWPFITTGKLLNHLHASDLVLFAAAALVALLLGGVFCGWICPFGAIQEWLYALRRKVWRREIELPARVDRLLRYGRYLVLVLVLGATYSTGELIFGEYCPWRAAWHLGGNEVAIGGVAVLGLVVVGGLLVERAWCRYACPLGAVLGLANLVAPVKLRRSEPTCTGCSLCNRKCPMGLKIDGVEQVSDTTCIRCLDCADSCPRPDTLNARLGGRPVKTWFYGAAAAVLFTGVIGGAMVTGNWQSTAAAVPPPAAGGLPDTEEIKGWRTLQEISNLWEIPLETLYGGLGLDPAAFPAATTKVKDLEGQVAPDGQAIDRTYVKALVDQWLAVNR
jgi:ferredoxin